MTLQPAILSEAQVPFPPEHEKKSLTRAGARDSLVKSREPRAYGFVMVAGAFHASAGRFGLASLPRRAMALLLVLAAVAFGAPEQAQAQVTVWSGTLTVHDVGGSGGGLGCHNASAATADWCSRTSALSDDDFTVDSSSSAFTWIALNSSGRLKVQFIPFLALNLRGLTFHVGNSAFSFLSADEIEDFSTVSEREWNNTGLSWSVGDTVSLSLTIPSTTGVSTISTPRFDNTYLRGEHIEIAVDFSDVVTVTGSPQLHLALGDDPANLAGKVAAYNRGSGTTRLVFRYTVESGIKDTSGINLNSNPLRLNGGTISGRRTLSDWMGLLPAQNIDGDVTYATGASIVSTPRFLNSYIQGEHIEVAVDFNNAVTVAGFPRLVLALGDDPANLAEKAAAYNRGSGTARLVFRYTVESGIKDTTGINLYSNPLRLNSGTIRKGSNDARLDTLADWLTLLPAQSVNGARVDAACPAPNLTGKRQVWTGTVSVEEDGGSQGFNDRSTAFGSLDHDDFSIGSTDYEVNAILLFEGEADVESDSILNFNLAPGPSTELVASLTLYVCDAAFTLGNAVESPDSFGTSYIWQNNNLVWSTVATRTVYLAVRQNRAASGRPAISGTATVGSTLTATRGTIADADGVPAESTFSYQWIRVDGSSESDISGATSSTYTLVTADAGKKFKVRVSFTDNLGNMEAPLTSGMYPPSVPSAPQNLEVTAGDALAVLTWEAPASDGGADITRYQYRHAAGTTVPTSMSWTNVPDGTDIFTSTADEKGVTISSLTNGTQYAFEVRAMNVAGGGAGVGPVTATPLAAACAAPNFGARRNIWTGALSVGTIAQIGIIFAHGYAEAVGDLDDKDFPIGSNTHEIDAVSVFALGDDAGLLRFSLKHANLTAAEKAALRLHVCNAAFDFSAAPSPDSDHTYQWANSGLDWSQGFSSRTLYLGLPANNPATGKPVISGTAEVGQMLTAVTSSIADADGLPSSLAYQWVRVDAGVETDISGATSSTYTLVTGDEGKKFRVKVSFTDDLGGVEELTSDVLPETLAPMFANDTAARSFTETVGDAAVVTAGDVGAVVTATDQDGDTLAYTLEGEASGKFTVDSASGQIRTKPGQKYDRETTASYSVTVKASDGFGGTDTIAVTISVDNAVEAPLAPDAPTVSAPSDSTTSLDVQWTTPGNTGRSDITGYKLRYRQGTSGGWIDDHLHTGSGTSTTITGLAADRLYQAQVRALNADGEGEWSASGSASTSGTVADSAPGAPAGFTATAGDTEVALSWSAPTITGGVAITHYQYRYATGAVVPSGTAWREVPDSDNDGSLADERGVTVTGLVNQTQYAFEVRAVNGVGEGLEAAATATTGVVTVPRAPASFTATAGNAKVDLSWMEPESNGGSAITKYRYRYAAGSTVPSSVSWRDVPDSDDAGASTADERGVTVTGLVNETQYAFEVQAVNSAGEGPAASASATPAEHPNLPSVVLELRAQTGDGTVTLEWGPPLRTGSHKSIDYYEYRYAEGSSVPTSWATVDEGRYPFAQITGLENGRRYAFEVRAVNKHGFKGAVAKLTATPRAPVVQTLPSAPRRLSAAGSLYQRNVSELAQVELRWEAPADLGNTTLVRYEYRYAAGGDSLSSWVTSGDSAEVTAGRTERVETVRNLEPGTAYRFEVRAVTMAGAGRAASARTTTPSSERLTLTVFTRGTAVEGEDFTVGVRRSGIPASDEEVLLVVVEIYDSTRSSYTQKSVDIAVGAREGTATFRVPFDGKRGASRELEVTLSPGSWVLDRVPEGVNPTTYRVGTPASATVRVRNMDPLLRVADATVRENPQAVLRFDVSLDRAAAERVTVDYATSDGTAIAGVDYTETSGRLTFAAGETAMTVPVPVIDDAHDEDIETLTLTLSNPSGAAIDDGTATGRIVNTDPMPTAWLARFGRTSATQVLGLLDARFDEARAPASQLTLGGRPVNLSGLRGDKQGRADPDDGPVDPAAGPAPAHTDPAAVPVPAGGRTAASPLTLRGGSQGRADPGAEPAPADADPFDVLAAQYTLDDSVRGPAARHADPAADPDPDAGAVGAGGEATLLERLAWKLLTRGGWSVDRRQFLSGSSFDLSLSALGRETDAEAIETARVRETPGHWSLWGRGALLRFTGQDRGLSLDGDVLTGLLGLDYSRGRWLAGVGLAYNDGYGAYRAPDSGAVGELDSTLVSVHPYLHYALTERLSAWGTLGYGVGGLRLRLGRDGANEQETLETDIQMRMGALGLRGMVFANASTELALKSDLMWVRTTSSATAGLAAVDGADASRVRLLLTGRHRHALATGAELTPNVELGLRYDDGDAETGAGVELGGGLRYADPALGLTVEATARALLAHEAGGYEEWGMGGSLQLDPGRLGRGLSLQLASGWGLTDSSTETLWQQQTASGLTQGAGQTSRGRVKAEWAYGLDVPWTHGLLTPYGSVEMAGGGGRTLALGWRFELGQSLSLRLAGERRETALARPEHGLMLQTTLPW